MPSLHLKILIMLLFQFPLTFLLHQTWMSLFIEQTLITFVLAGMFFTVIKNISLTWKGIFSKVGSISITLAAKSFEWVHVGVMYISLINSIMPNLSHPHSFHLLVLLALLIDILPFVWTSKTDTFCLMSSSDRLAFVGKVHLDLLNLLRVITERVPIAS